MVAEVVVASGMAPVIWATRANGCVLFRTGRFSIGQEETGGKPVTTWVEE